MSKFIEYQSENGYTGILYGRSSFSIRDKNGTEVFHTGFRKINTYEELVKEVEEFPKFLEILFSADLEEEDDGI